MILNILDSIFIGIGSIFSVIIVIFLIWQAIESMKLNIIKWSKSAILILVFLTGFYFLGEFIKSLFGVI